MFDSEVGTVVVVPVVPVPSVVDDVDPNLNSGKIELVGIDEFPVELISGDVSLLLLDCVSLVLLSFVVDCCDENIFFIFLSDSFFFFSRFLSIVCLSV